MKISVTKKNKLSGIISIEVEKKDYEQKVQDVLKRYSKTANIPGFRKGFVPMGLVKKQYGNAVKVDEINKLLDANLKKYIQEEKLDILGGPIPEVDNKIDWNSDKINFDFEIGYTPEFKVNLKPKKPITMFEVKADKKMVDNQIKNIQSQYGKLISKKTIEKIIYKKSKVALDQYKKIVGNKNNKFVSENSKKEEINEEKLIDNLIDTEEEEDITNTDSKIKQNKLGINITYNLDEVLNWCDAVIALRIQLERMHLGRIPSKREYHSEFGLTFERISKLKKDIVIMHPGPMNRGVEIDSKVADSDNAVILDQVLNGVASRMSILYLLLGEGDMEI